MHYVGSRCETQYIKSWLVDFWIFESHFKELTPPFSFKTECKDNKVVSQVKKYAAEKKDDFHIDPVWDVAKTAQCVIHKVTQSILKWKPSTTLQSHMNNQGLRKKKKKVEENNL